MNKKGSAEIIVVLVVIVLFLTGMTLLIISSEKESKIENENRMICHNQCIDLGYDYGYFEDISCDCRIEDRIKFVKGKEVVRK